MLRVEQAAVALAPSAAIVGLWAVAALAGEAVWLPVPAVALSTAAAAAAVIVLAIRRVSRLTRPSAAAPPRRLEIASALPHRPLAALRDHPAPTAAFAGASAALWSAHQARLAGRLDGLRAGWPRPPLATIDRWQLRFAIPALLVLGFAGARSQSGNLLLAALLPGLEPRPGAAGRIEAWITPPAFSAMAPVFLHPDASDGGEPPPVPAGSTLSVSLTGSDADPRLVFDGRANGRPRFHRLAPSSWQASAVLRRSTTLRIRQGGHLVAAWDLLVEPVGAPSVAWASPPGAWRGGWRTRLPWSVGDRFGVTALRAELRPVRPAGAPPIVVAIPLEGEPKHASGTELPDLVASPFAGTEVDATLLATNGAGLVGRSRPERFTLPSRPFHDPLARAVLAVRRRLALDPGSRRGAVSDLETLGDVPGAFAGRLGLFLNLESVAALLAVEPGPAAIEGAEARLWQLALQIEDAKRGRATAESDLALQSARDAVDRQLAHMRELGAAGRTAPEQAELARRLSALRHALASRMAALTRDALRKGLVLPPDAGRMQFGANAFDRMMRSVQGEAEAGHVDDAARTLSRMEDLLDRMRPATADDVRRALAAREADTAARADMAAVGDMVKREASLLDHAQKRQEQAREERGDNGSDGATSPGDLTSPLMGDGADAGLAPPAPPPPSPLSTSPSAASPPSSSPPSSSPPSSARTSGPVAAAGGAPGGGADAAAAAATRDADRRIQAALGRAAGVVAAQFGGLSGKPPDALGKAGDAMARAVTALRAGDDHGAAADEQEVLRDLQQGGKQMAAAMQGGGGAGSGGGALLPGFASAGPGDGGDDGSDGADDGAQAEGADRDPFGRNVDGQGKGSADDTELAIPGDGGNAESRAIEEELRRRDSDRQRPRPELDYLGRLLQPF